MTNPTYISVDGVLFTKNRSTLVQYPLAKQGDAYAIPNGVTTIGVGAFDGCIGLTSVTIPNSTIEIRESAFGGTSLTSVTIPSGVTKIGFNAFSGCVKLTSITISSNVKSIGLWAFRDCPNLISVTSLNPVPPIIEEGNAFYDGVFAATATLYVPESGLNAYKRAKGWRAETVGNTRGFKRIEKIQPAGN
jgi:hypothetical protein